MTGARHAQWRVSWHPSIPVQELKTPEPMTEGGARRYFRDLRGGRRVQVWPVFDGFRCTRCGQLVAIHAPGLPQFARCYV